MAVQRVVVEFGFGSTWQTEPGDITWYDETENVLLGPGVRTRRGASAARGKVDVGTSSLSLLNSDRRFDPLYEDGPYFGDLKPGCPMRIRVPVGSLLVWDGVQLTWDGVDLEWGVGSVIWTGTVPSWPQRYDVSNNLAVVPISGFDGFDKLSRAKIPRSPVEAAVMPLEPVGYWPLTDPSDTRDVTDVVGENFGSPVDEPTFGVTALMDGLGTCVTFDGSNDRVDVSRSPIVADCLNFTMAMVFRTEETPAAGTAHPLFQQSNGNATPSDVLLYVHTDDQLVVVGTIDGGGWAFSPATVVTDGDPHIVIAQVDETSTYSGIALDSSALDDTGTTAVLQMANGVGIGGSPFAAKDFTDNHFPGEISHVVLWDRPLDDAERAAVYEGFLALDGQTADERAGWILDELDWPVNLRDMEVGKALLGPATFVAGDQALGYLRLIEATEDGRVFITADGSLRFYDRLWRWSATEATVSQYTFTDDATADSQYAEFQLDLDDELLVNVARYTRRGGSEQVVSDATSVATYGEAEVQVSDLLVRTDNEALSLAEWKVVTSKDPQPRCPTIRIPLTRYSEAAQQTVLELEQGYRVTVERTPQGVGDPIVLDMVIDGIEHDISDAGWWVTLFVSPAPDATVSPFVWGVSNWNGADVWAP